MCMIPKACKVVLLYRENRRLVCKGVAMEKIVRQSLLFDFYGELLTEHQKEIYEDCVESDMSYSEVAGLYGISRQGVYDMVHRCDKILEGYEEKLSLVKRFLAAREQADRIMETVNTLQPLLSGKKDCEQLAETLRRQTEQLMEEL